MEKEAEKDMENYLETIPEPFREAEAIIWKAKYNEENKEKLDAFKNLNL